MNDGFTPSQQAAITAGDGPLGIIAGPGCGKTTALAARIAHLVRERGADPASILVAIPTALAARGLRHEVSELRRLWRFPPTPSIGPLHPLEPSIAHHCTTVTPLH